MRAIGSAERAFELMCERAHSREAFGGKLAEKQFVQDFIAKSRMVIDRAMQVHGALGMSDDVPLAMMWRQGRWLRIADGPDEVHKMVIAVRELNRFKPREPVEA